MITGYIYSNIFTSDTICSTCANSSVKSGEISPDCLTPVDSRDTYGYELLCETCLDSIHTQDTMLPDLGDSSPKLTGYLYRQEDKDIAYCKECASKIADRPKCRLVPIHSNESFGYELLCETCLVGIYTQDAILPDLAD